MIAVGSRKFLATLVSVLAAVAVLGVAAWMLMGSNDGGPQADADVRIISPGDVSGVADASASSLPAATPAPAQIAVYLTGEVVNPGVYQVPAGQRLIDVVNLAGGPTENADLNRVNLAAYVSDAGHYRIPTADESGDGVVATALSTEVLAASNDGQSAPGGACAVPLDINTATAECLDTLPGIGSVRAQSIVTYREQTGPFVTPDGITAVSGIGDGIYGRIAGMITVASR